MNQEFWAGKRVFLTGHTGFKGGWLALWLTKLGAQVHGYALAPKTNPALFHVASIQGCLASSTIADIRDLPSLTQALVESQPDIVLHLAAQPLVRYSYQAPLETFDVNVMGTANLLQACLGIPSIRAVVNVTTDKCYENKEWVWPYRENEPLGGHDPYSASKACSELVTAAFRNSFYRGKGIGLASARAGNVIGGGDWSDDRLIPDFLRAIDARQTLRIRSPRATRPWQHVLEPLAGYLQLAENLHQQPEVYAEPFNFGPEESDVKSVEWITRRLCSQVPGSAFEIESSNLHEATSLKLDSSKAKRILAWAPRWSLTQALNATVEWHLAWKGGANVQQVCHQQIEAYQAQVSAHE